MTRIILAFAICGAALGVTPASAQGGNTQAAPTVPPAPSPAPYDSSRAPSPNPPKASAAADGKAPPILPFENAPQNSAAAEGKPAENIEGRFTFGRVDDGYVRLDNRTGQVSFCSKRAVGWTCQLAPEDRGALESEIARLQEENVLLKKEFLARGLPLPGSVKSDPPIAQNDRPSTLPSDPNVERMKAMVEKAWRRLVEMISTLQKEVLKKS